MNLKLEENVLKYSNQQPLLYRNLNLQIDEFKLKMINYSNFILDIIETRYSINHPFRQKDFIYKPTLYQLAYAKLVCEEYLNNKNILEDYLMKKLISNENGNYNIDLFNRNMSECIFFLYILMGIYIKSNLFNEISSIIYEPISVNNKKLEYTFKFRDGYKINIEVKTIDCDPFLKDRQVMEILDLSKKNVYIKKYFKDIDIDEELKEIFEEGGTYSVLSSNYRQVNKNIAKIREKFNFKSDKDINIGVLVIDYGTSREEYFSYLLHKDNGSIKKIDFGNIDNLILFSNTHQSSFTFDEIYDTEHIFSVTKNLDRYTEELYNKLRIDNYIVKNGVYVEPYSNFQDDVFGIYTSENINGLFTLLPYYVSYEERSKYLNEINRDNEAIFNYDINVCKEHGLFMDR